MENIILFFAVVAAVSSLAVHFHLFNLTKVEDEAEVDLGDVENEIEKL